MPWIPISCPIFSPLPQDPINNCRMKITWPLPSPYRVFMYMYARDPIHIQYYIFNVLFKWYHIPCSFFKLAFSFFHSAPCFGDLSILLYIGASAFFT